MFHSKSVEYLLQNFEKVSDFYMETNLFIFNSTAFSRTLLDYYFPAGTNPINMSDQSVESNLTQVLFLRIILNAPSSFDNIKNNNNNNNNNNLLKMTGDGLITWPNYHTLNMQTKGMKSNVYFYSFAYIGTFSLTFDYKKSGSHVSGKLDEIYWKVTKSNHIFDEIKYADLCGSMYGVFL